MNMVEKRKTGLSEYQAQYLAWELTKRCPSDSLEKIAGALVDAQVDLNPHQVDAALFAFRSPFSKGALLADEVGLGKTIEAGLVLSQKWAERKRRILIITPANLRKQWVQELGEKFFIPCKILETQSYREAVKNGETRPFEPKKMIVICSYQFANNHAQELKTTSWDLVVIDEAHRLRNVYKNSNVIANTLKLALKERCKLLLTATPLQNSLLELYGLVGFIDERVFGDLKVFREQYASLRDRITFNTLRNRLQPVCHRTLRRQVAPYVLFTRRHPILQPFTPEESEDKLYILVSAYLQRPNILALPSKQRSLMTLVMRKLLASSSFAIAGTLETLSQRLKSKLNHCDDEQSLFDEMDEDFESLDETAEDWGEDEGIERISDENRSAIIKEIEDLDSFRELAVSITHNAKGKALLVALKKAFAEAARLGASPKAIIFTESRRTQNYLERVLSDSPWHDGIVLFNGSNSDEKSKAIYTTWLDRNKGTDRVTGSKTADMRSALVDYFRNEGKIMIATEAGAEGINLQFCSLVVNYDLPWNPQRVEQRIGRCHRYGQKHDVVVVNFLNQKNEADRRVFELLDQKFQLFEGVFGASDEVLGAIESGVDFEKRIASIYQNCRTPEEIQASFDELQAELSSEIDETMTMTRKQLLENFDEEVQEKLKINLENSQIYLNRYERMLMQLSRFELGDHADFCNDMSSFRLLDKPFNDMEVPLGLYELPRRSGEAYLYRLAHPLAQRLLKTAKERKLEPVEITFDLSAHRAQVAALQPLLGAFGFLKIQVISVTFLNQAEDHILFSCCSESDIVVDDDQVQRLLMLPVQNHLPLSECQIPSIIDTILDEKKEKILGDIRSRNNKFFDQEVSKLEAWAEDVKQALEQDIKDLDRQIRETKRSARSVSALEDKLKVQREVKVLEGKRNQKRLLLFESQDKVDAQRDALIEQIETRLAQQVEEKDLFSIRWRLV